MNQQRHSLTLKWIIKITICFLLISPLPAQNNNYIELLRKVELSFSVGLATNIPVGEIRKSWNNDLEGEVINLEKDYSLIQQVFPLISPASRLEIMYPIGKKIYLITALQFEPKGYHFNRKLSHHSSVYQLDEIRTFNRRVKVNTWSIPLGLQVKLGAKSSIQTALVYGFLQSSSASIKLKEQTLIIINGEYDIDGSRPESLSVIQDVSNLPKGYFGINASYKNQISDRLFFAIRTSYHSDYMLNNSALSNLSLQFNLGYNLTTNHKHLK